MMINTIPAGPPITACRPDFPIHFEMGVFGPADSASAFIPGTTARMLEYVPFSGSLATRLYDTAARWVGDTASHKNAADCLLESAYYFAGAGRICLRAWEKGGALRKGFEYYIRAKEQIDKAVDLNDTADLRLAQSRIYRRIRWIHRMQRDVLGISWLTKELEINIKGMALSPESPEKLYFAGEMIEVGRLLSISHALEAKKGLAVIEHLETAAKINEMLSDTTDFNPNDPDGMHPLNFIIEAIDCYRAILENQHDIPTDKRLSLLRRLSNAYKKAGEYYKNLNNTLGSAEMHYQAGAASEHIARILHETSSPEYRAAATRKEYNIVLQYLTSSASAFGEAGKSWIATAIRKHMGEIDFFLSNMMHEMPEPLSAGYIFEYPEESYVRRVFKTPNAVEAAVEAEFGERGLDVLDDIAAGTEFSRRQEK